MIRKFEFLCKMTWWKLTWKIGNVLDNINEKKLKRKYQNWNFDYWIEDMEYVWGIKSWDDLSGSESNIHTMNDIEILYHHKEKEYSLDIETAFVFTSLEAEKEYLNQLLDAFRYWMLENDKSTNEKPRLFMSSPSITMKAETLPQLYYQFKIYVNGYNSL